MEETAKKKMGRPKGIKKPYEAFSIKLPCEFVQEFKDEADKAGMSYSKFMQELLDMWKNR